MLKDFFVTGDLHSAALVIDGSVHWLCMPRFDSDPIFARVLDRNGGHFSIEAEGYSRNTSYIKDTAVLEHCFKKDGAEFTVVDYMLPRPIEECARHVFVRKIKGIRGRNIPKFVFVPTRDYAREPLEFEQDGTELRARKGDDDILLTLPQGTGVHRRGSDYLLETEIAEGEEKQLVLEYSVNGFCTGEAENHEDEVIGFWRDWIGKGRFVERYRDTLARAAINLKLLQFYPSGGLVAAPTTSVPVEMGGMRNWDYRYVWIRDAAFTLYGFHVLGYEEEAERFFRFLQDAVREGEVKVLYTIDGKEGPPERTLDYLEGYRNSKPVRIGNQAGTQFQLDAYGSIVDAYYFAQKRGIEITEEDAAIIRRMVEHIERDWMRKDSGIWEMQLPEQHYTYSKVMAWVGADRGSRMC
ncbi:MAG: glycoside hydrolase family 15 protein, partial [Spirochaetia bacterium]